VWRDKITEAGRESREDLHAIRVNAITVDLTPLCRAWIGRAPGMKSEQFQGAAIFVAV